MVRELAANVRSWIRAIAVLTLLALLPTGWAAVWRLTHSHGVMVSGIRVRPPWRWITGPRWVGGGRDTLIKMPYFASFIQGTIFGMDGGGPKGYAYQLRWDRQRGYPLLFIPPGNETYCAEVPGHSGLIPTSGLILNCTVDNGRRKLIMIGEPGDLAFFLRFAEAYSIRYAGAHP